MSMDVNALVKDAIRAYKEGKKSEARLLLERATDADPENEKAWMWMSAVVDEPTDQRICLENVLIINPNSDHAKKGLEILRQKHPEAFKEQSAPEPEPEPPLPEPPQQSNWDIPITATSSASSVFVPDSQPDSEEYDDWVAGLNLGGGSESSSSQYNDEGQFLDNLDFMNNLDDKDDSASLRLDTMGSSSTFSSDAFSSADFTAGGDSFEDDDLLDSFDMDESEQLGDDLLGDPLLDDFDDDLLDSFDVDSPMSPGESITSGAAFASDSYDDLDDEVDPSAYFDAIPEDIAPTRLPGTDERYPVLVIVGLIVLVLLNIGAAGFLVMNVAG